MVATAAQCRIGCSGYQYDHWRGVFYPPGLPKRMWLAYYAERFDTVEINNTFYRVPEQATFDRWHAEAPPGFLYALKFSRFGTHNKKLLDPRDTIGYFLERAAPLGETLGPILIHLPPRWRCNPERLDQFLATARAADSGGARRRWAVELRHESWLCEDVFKVLRRHRAALCIHDILPDHPPVLTADWTYFRFHGASPAAKPAGNYPDRALAEHAATLRSLLERGIDIYAYFNNDQQGFAVANALRLQKLLQLPDPAASGLAVRPSPRRRTATPRSRR